MWSLWSALKYSLFNGLSRKCGYLSWTINFSRINFPTLRGYGCAEKPHFLCSKFAKLSRENSCLINQPRWEARHLEKVCPAVSHITFFHVHESSTHYCFKIYQNYWYPIFIFQLPSTTYSCCVSRELLILGNFTHRCQLRFLPLEVHFSTTDRALD